MTKSMRLLPVVLLLIVGLVFSVAVSPSRDSDDTHYATFHHAIDQAETGSSDTFSLKQVADDFYRFTAKPHNEYDKRLVLNQLLLNTPLQNIDHRKMSADTLIKTYHALRPSDATKSDRSRYGRFLKEILRHKNASDDYLQNVVEHQIFLQNMTIRNRKDERRKEVGLPPLPPYQPRAKGRSSASKAKQRKNEEQQTEKPKRTRNVNSGQFLEDFNSSFSLITGPDFNYHQQDPEEYRNVQAGRLFNSMRHFYRAKSTEKIKSDALVEVYSEGGPLQYLDPRTVDPITFANAFYHLTRRDMTSRDRGRLGFFRNECIRYKRDDKKYCNDANRHYTRLSKYFQDLQNKHKNSELPPRHASSMEDAESSRMEEEEDDEEEGKVEEGKGEESGNNSDGDRPDSPFDPYNFEQRPWYEGYFD